MHNAPLAIGLISLLLSAATSAAPLEARLPGQVEIWFASSHLDTTCGGGAFQSFAGSSSSCNVIKDSHPPAQLLVNIGSILIGSEFGVYDFTFLSDSTCNITGLADIIHKVGSGQRACVDVSSLKPGSFHVANISPALPLVPHGLPERSTTALDARIFSPVSLWNLTTFGDDACGKSIQNFHGSGSSSCERITGQVSNPRIPLSIETQSVFVNTLFGNYDFSFFSNNKCQIGQTNQPLYRVEGGQCIPLGDLNPESFQVKFVKGTVTVPGKPNGAVPTDLEARGIFPISCLGFNAWKADTFTTANCAGHAVESIDGGGKTCDTGGSSSCNAVQDSSPDIQSVLLTVFPSASGTYDFTFYPNDHCEVTPLNNEIHTVTAGEDLCVTLPTGLNLRSIQEVFLG